MIMVYCKGINFAPPDYVVLFVRLVLYIMRTAPAKKIYLKSSTLYISHYGIDLPAGQIVHPESPWLL
jgi:hypothetical protein